MSSDRPGKIINFPVPASKKSRKIHKDDIHKKSAVLHSNIITPKDEIWRGKKISSKNDQFLYREVIMKSNTKNSIEKSEKKVVSNIVDPGTSFWNRAEKQKISSKKDQDEKQTVVNNDSFSSSEKKWEQEKNQDVPRYIVPSVAAALCLMLVGVPFMNQHSQPKGRGLASPSPQQQEKRRLQQKKVMHLIRTGQRKIASVGEKPKVKDVFSIQLLGSHYNLKWKRDKLVYAVLEENKKPVVLPSIDEVVKQYSSLFSHL